MGQKDFSMSSPRHLTIKKIWLVIYMFLAIFQPPFLPVSTIYVFGLFTIFLLMLNSKKFIDGTGDRIGINTLANKSGLTKTYVRLFAVALYIVVVSIIDVVFVDSTNLYMNRLQCVNQLLVLTGIEFLAVVYVLRKAAELKLNFYDLIELLVIVGILQGLCAVSAYLIPGVRSLFLKFGGDIYQNEYVISRRGFGFSTTLLDTFGYGMGLIVGCAIIVPIRHKSVKLLGIVLGIFAILVNSRTGFVVLAVALVCFIIKGGKKKRHFLYYILAIGIIVCIAFVVLPYVVNIGASSSNVTIRWVSNSIQELYNVALFRQDLNSASFLSNLTAVPTNFFEMLFGSGHSVYGVRDIIGFHSDVGYINLLWTYGIFGSIIIFIILGSLVRKAFKRSYGKAQKFLVAFVAISYIIVLLKAILLGYNPGVMVTYLILFSLVYFGRKEKVALYGRKLSVAAPVGA